MTGSCSYVCIEEDSAAFSSKFVKLLSEYSCNTPVFERTCERGKDMNSKIGSYWN